ncbi:hypothetical protein PUN28_008984 [Cardiocondyla obscurior]|uniref:Uncharacterized protein n=1 Tax=Cardiocondyla obscurior TaxID=286306 RepID=A0AAW2FPW1_9HYME
MYVYYSFTYYLHARDRRRNLRTRVHAGRYFVKFIGISSFSSSAAAR